MVTGDDIIGSWLLVDRGTDNPVDQKQAIARYGDNPRGFAIFAPDGWMNAIVCWGGRADLTGKPEWHTDAPADEKIKAFDTYLSYGGRWTVDNGRLTTKVEFALNPGWVGGEQVRQLEMSADGRLTLKLSRKWPDGHVVNGWVRWRRANT